MPNAADIPADFRMFALFVGRYDAGKTTAAASWPGQKYVWDFDGRITSLRGRRDVDFDFFNSMNMGFKEADSKLDIFKVQAKQRQHPYSMHIFDSLSMGRRNMLFDSMKYTAGIEKGVVRGRRIGELFLPTTQDYGYESEALMRLIYGLKSLNCNVVVTGHTVPEYKTITEPGKPSERIIAGEKIYGDPNLMAVLPIAFTEVYYFSKEVDPTGKIRRFVEFDGEVARTTYPVLSEAGKVELTGKSFYEVWKSLVKPEEKIEGQTSVKR